LQIVFEEFFKYVTTKKNKAVTVIYLLKLQRHCTLNIT
jgi:hypothetical protein